MNSSIVSVSVLSWLVFVSGSGMADRLTEDRCTRNCGERNISRSNTVGRLVIAASS